MRVTVLGCSGTYAGPGEACSGYLVESDGVSVLLDTGSGTLAQLGAHLAPERLDAVLVSHSHPDHWVDLPVLRNALRYVIGHEGLPVYSTAETLGLLSSVAHDHVTPTMALTQIADGSVVRVGHLEIRCSRTEHPPETLGFCVHDGRSTVAYSADSGPGWGFAEFGRPVDLGLCEATFRLGHETDVPVHMNAHEAGTMARESGTGRLVITHLLPGADREGARLEAEDAYGAPVDVASAGLVLEV